MARLGILFWNMAKRAEARHVGAIASELRPDIVVLAEMKVSRVSVVEALADATGTTFPLPEARSERLHFFVRAGLRVEPLHDGAGISVRHVVPVIGDDFLLVGVHLPSKLHLTDFDQASLLTRMNRRIVEAEDQVGHARTILIGDLNMDPFEHGMVGSEGLHATMSKAVAGRQARTVLGESRRFFYNPMWSFLGDTSPGPPGTYFFASSSPLTYFWHMFDQVLVRAEIAEQLQPSDVQVVTSAGGIQFLDNGGRPDRSISDHLPLFVTVTMQEELRGFQELVG